jgi:hypothetical protein
LQREGRRFDPGWLHLESHFLGGWRCKSFAIFRRTIWGMGTGDHVLVVDDEPIVRESLERYLTRDGFNVTTAADRQAALDALRLPS